MRHDIEELRTRAVRLERAASSLRTEAFALGTRGEAGWVSTEARRWRDELTELQRDLRLEADRLDDAAAALRRHAHDVEDTLDRIASVEAWFSSRLADARRVLEAGAETVGAATVDAARSVVDAARSAPGPGSLSWLRFRW